MISFGIIVVFRLEKQSLAHFAAETGFKAGERKENLALLVACCYTKRKPAAQLGSSQRLPKVTFLALAGVLMFELDVRPLFHNNTCRDQPS